MAVPVAPVFMQVQVDDGKVGMQQIEELEVVVVGGPAEVGMAKVEAQADSVGVSPAAAGEGLEQGVAFLRTRQGRVFHGKPDGGGRQAVEERFESPHERGSRLLAVKMQIQEVGAEILGQGEALGEDGRGSGFQGIGPPGCMHRQAEVVDAGLLSDNSPLFRAEIVLGPSRARVIPVGEPFEGVEPLVEGEGERPFRTAGGDGGLIADTDVHRVNPPSSQPAAGSEPRNTAPGSRHLRYLEVPRGAFPPWYR